MRAPRGTKERSGRVLVVAGTALALLFAGYLAAGMPGMDHSADAMADMDHTQAAGMQELTPAELNARAADQDAFLVNVHVPAEGSIIGTDATIAYDTIADSSLLPANRDVEIVLYCESARMSEIAGRTLVDEDYRNVSHLEGGLQAWRRAGLKLDASLRSDR